MTDSTVVYYTSNRERPEFESRIRRHILDMAGGLPIISVSQKPIGFGLNICVGDVGLSNVNVFRQMRIGVEAATTRYIITAESDYLHPKEYFEFQPARDDTLYYAMPLWVLFAQRGTQRCFCLKDQGSEAAMIVNREVLLTALNKMLRGHDEWLDAPGNEIPLPYLYDLIRKEPFQMTAPCVTFKTMNQLHRRTPHNQASRCREIPYWGKSHDLIAEYAAE